MKILILAVGLFSTAPTFASIWDETRAMSHEVDIAPTPEREAIARAFFAQNEKSLPEGSAWQALSVAHRLRIAIDQLRQQKAAAIYADAFTAPADDNRAVTPPQIHALNQLSDRLHLWSPAKEEFYIGGFADASLIRRMTATGSKPSMTGDTLLARMQSLGDSFAHAALNLERAVQDENLDQIDRTATEAIRLLRETYLLAGANTGDELNLFHRSIALHGGLATLGAMLEAVDLIYVSNSLSKAGLHLVSAGLVAGPLTALWQNDKKRLSDGVGARWIPRWMRYAEQKNQSDVAIGDFWLAVRGSLLHDRWVLPRETRKQLRAANLSGKIADVVLFQMQNSISRKTFENACVRALN